MYKKYYVRVLKIEMFVVRIFFIFCPVQTRNDLTLDSPRVCSKLLFKFLKKKNVYILTFISEKTSTIIIP